MVGYEHGQGDNRSKSQPRHFERSVSFERCYQPNRQQCSANQIGCCAIDPRIPGKKLNGRLKVYHHARCMACNRAWPLIVDTAWRRSYCKIGMDLRPPAGCRKMHPTESCQRKPCRQRKRLQGTSPICPAGEQKVEPHKARVMRLGYQADCEQRIPTGTNRLRTKHQTAITPALTTIAAALPTAMRTSQSRRMRPTKKVATHGAMPDARSRAANPASTRDDIVNVSHTT